MRTRWSSPVGFIWAATGAAVGLGNIWKFPYMAGSHGGSAFFLAYLLLLAVLGIPLLIAEILLGKMGQANAIDTYQKLHPQRAWTGVGILGMLTLLVVLSFYSVVSGWILAYWGHALFHQTSPDLLNHITHHFSLSVLYHTLFMALCALLVGLGVKVLETSCRLMMPLLLMILLLLDLHASTLQGFHQGLHFLFHIKSIDAAAWLFALGHALFTLAVGAGAMLVYGSYLEPQAPIAKTTLIVAFLDVVVALSAGIAIFPLVFTYHLPPQSGPGLMFETLPLAFAHISHGNTLALGFFTLLFMAALTSAINLLEPLVALLLEKTSLSRPRATLWVSFIVWLLGLLPAASDNRLAGFTPFKQTVFDAMSNLATNILLPLGALGIALFVAWALPASSVKKSLSPQSWTRLWLWLLKFLVPLGILRILL